MVMPPTVLPLRNPLLLRTAPRYGRNVFARAVFLAAVAVSSVPAAAARPAAPRLLTIAVTAAPIEAVVQDGGAVVWRTSCSAAPRVTLRSVAGRQLAAWLDDTEVCPPYRDDPPFLALAGSRV